MSAGSGSAGSRSAGPPEAAAQGRRRVEEEASAQRPRRSGAQRPLVACDTMLHWIEDERDALLRVVARADVLFVNEEEARALGAGSDPDAAAQRVLERGPRWVVVKRGGRGATLFGGSRPLSVPAFPVERVLDPTGAGDAFAAGFLGYLAAAAIRGRGTLREALLHGAAAGSFAVEGFSVTPFEGLTADDLAWRAARLGRRSDREAEPGSRGLPGDRA